MSYDTPLSASGQQLTDLPFREQLRRGFRDMGSRSFSSAKNFGLVGAIFAGTECCIEGVSCQPHGFYGAPGLILISVPGKERPYEWHNCGLYYWRCSRCKGRSSSRCYRMCRLCSVQCCHRFIHAHGLGMQRDEERTWNRRFVWERA